ncbi:helix-turn-helix domain-containing protein [Bifidobacterium xylocopae]|uniref:Transcriptional regulator n=1 Tax=Bifidobacterium xylocopae TaxID=2493119 RepID=A0A366KG25_9BIFI|nr:helix-turn-helix transcriptional regulator [Bifidobacterium xylocopae]RBP99641.1 transcriptional regulator [Bifidobacterium xylocopae]
MPQAVFTDEEWVTFAREFGRNLQRLRSERNLSQEQLAAATGLSRSQCQRLEAGANRSGQPSNPSLRNLLALATALNTDLTTLVPEALACNANKQA